MAFRFTRQSDVEAQVRQLAVEQVEAAMDERRANGDFDETVHRVRRRCKKLRGLLRLVEPCFKGFKTENQAVRAAAEGLSRTRDAAVMIETFDGLLQFDRSRGRESQIGMGLAEALRPMLEGPAGRPPEDGARQHLLAEFSSAIEKVGLRARTWTIRQRGFAGLEDGLELTYRRMVEGMDTAIATDRAEAMHDWRKQAKYHWHHVGLLSHAAPDLLGNRKEVLDQLAELLGDHHNLHVLGESLVDHPGSVDSDAIATVEAVIALRQTALAERAIGLGRQLTAEKPAALRRRFEHYWHLLPEQG